MSLESQIVTYRCIACGELKENRVLPHFKVSTPCRRCHDCWKRDGSLTIKQWQAITLHAEADQPAEYRKILAEWKK